MPVIPASALSLDASALIDADRLHAVLAGAGTAIDVLAVGECGSTNALLAGLRPSAGTGAAGGPVLCVADRQTAGRGRRGRSWVSSPAGSLTFSLDWHFVRTRDLTGLSLAVGLALRRGLAECGFEAIRLKWPNDLLVATSPTDFAKLGGILIELSSQHNGIRAIVGVGINLRQPDAAALKRGAGPAAQPAIGLDAVSALPDRHDLLAALAGSLCRALQSFSGQGFAPLREAWNAAHAFADHDIVLHAEDGSQTSGRCLGVDADGALRVRTARGETRWLAGDVSLRSAGEPA
jgi:BirA family biotin operon repressor/biotin-[acetyl-CoA-carboxylase] ligase